MRATTAPPSNGDLNDTYCRAAPKASAPKSSGRILVGTYVSHGYYDAYYIRRKARAARSPTISPPPSPSATSSPADHPTVAYGIGAKPTTGADAPSATSTRVAVNPAGLPALSHPAGFWCRRPADGPAADRQLLRRSHAWASPTSSTGHRLAHLGTLTVQDDPPPLRRL